MTVDGFNIREDYTLVGLFDRIISIARKQFFLQKLIDDLHKIPTSFLSIHAYEKENFTISLKSLLM